MEMGSSGVRVSGGHWVHLSDDCATRADVSIVTDPKGYDYYLDYYPRPSDIYTLIEVHESIDMDYRSFRTRLFAEHKISSLWLVNLEREFIEVYNRYHSPDFKKGMIYQKGKVVRSHAHHQNFSVNELLKEKQG